MKIELYIGNSLLDFDQNVTCGFSVGDIRDITSGSIQSSYDIELPLTDRNKILLKFNNELNVFDEPTDYGRVYFDGIEVLRGKVIILGSIFRKTVKIIIQGTTWVDRLTGNKMRDLDLSGMNHILGSDNVSFSEVKYGYLYNWYATTDARNIAPAGWHVPTKAEILTLISILGDQFHGGDLKEIGTTHWNLPNTDANNSTGFTALGSGMRNGDGTSGLFTNLKETFIFWLSDIDVDPTLGITGELLYDSDQIKPNVGSYENSPKNAGLSVRLIKDDSTDTGTMTGNNGRVYTTIKIGTQVWTVENLAETKYRNGDSIPVVTDNYIWSTLDSPGLCYYNNDILNAYIGITSDPGYKYGLINFGRLFSQETSPTANWLPNDFIPMFNLVKIVQKIFEPWTVAGAWISKFLNDYILGVETKAPDDFITKKGLLIVPTSDDLQSFSIPGSTIVETYRTRTLNPVILDSETTDEGGDFASNQYIVPETGTYRFKFTCKTRAYDIGNHLVYHSEELTVSIRINNVDYKTFSGSYSANTIEQLVTVIDTGWIHLIAGDIVTGYCYMLASITNPDGSAHDLTLGIAAIGTQIEATWDNRNLYPGIGFPIVAKNYMPDVDIITFLKGLKDTYNLIFYADLLNQVIYIDTADDFRTNNIKQIQSSVSSVSSVTTDTTEVTTDGTEVVTNSGTSIIITTSLSVRATIDFTNTPETENVSSNYSKQEIMKFKTDTGDYAVTEWLKTHAEPSKTITLLSQFAKDGQETLENSLFAYTIQKEIYTPNATVPTIYGGEALGSNFVPLYRPTGFIPRLFRWIGNEPLVWTYDSVVKTNYPKVEPLMMTDLYLTCWLKTWHLIDQGKILILDIIPEITMLQQFITVVNDQAKEGFRVLFQFSIGAETYAGWLNNIQFDSGRARLEILLKK